MLATTTEHGLSISRTPAVQFARRGVGSRLAFLLLSAIAAPCAAVEGSDSSTTSQAPSGEPGTASAAATPAPEQAVTGAEAKKKAKEHFETGLRLYEDSDYALALIEFERAYSYIPDFRVLYNIGQVSVQLGRYARASQALNQYLKSGGSKIPAARVKAVHSDLAMLEGRTAHLTVKSNADGADVSLDDAPLGKIPMTDPVLVDAGEHRITLQKPGFITHTEPLVLAGRDETSLQIDLTEEPKNLTPERTTIYTPMQSTQPQPPPRAPAPKHNELLYVGWGATGLLAAGWAVTGIIGIKAATDLHNELNHTTTPDQLDSLKVKARGWLLASDILGGAALVTGGTTLFFTIKRSSHDQPGQQAGTPTIRLGVGPSAVQLNGNF